MATSAFSPRIGIYGADETVSAPSRGCCLWRLGYGPAVSEAGGTPVFLALPRPRSLCEKILEDLDGLLLVAREADGFWQSADADWICRSFGERRLALLVVRPALPALYTACCGSRFVD